MAKKAVKKAPKAAKKVLPAKLVGGAAASADDAVRVRMYRQGLGDCFLLTFGGAPTARHVLIDCGTRGNSNKSWSMDAIVKAIDAETGGKLTLLIATHEHVDHVSGFKDGLFKMTADHVWQAWTENPHDKDAIDFAKKHPHDLGAALTAMMRLPGVAAALPDVADLLGFFGAPQQLAAEKGFAETVDRAMKFVRDTVGSKERTRFCEPGEVIEESWLPGWRVYVLGPPRDPAALMNDGEKDTAGLYGFARLAARAHGIASADPMLDAAEEQMPFDIRYRRDASSAAAFFPDYFDDENDWRSIENNHLLEMNELALQLDNAINNTSLALAFERMRDGKVLLFPGDAQRGNWESWGKLQWKRPASGGKPAKVVTIDDLLGATVFYKVGHHSSHNATLKAHGLERMDPKNAITAFIPVDRLVASHAGKTGWKMPAVPLYRALLDLCEGRVVRSDIGWASDPRTNGEVGLEEDRFKALATVAEWKAWAKTQDATEFVTAKPAELFVEYRLA